MYYLKVAFNEYAGNFEEEFLKYVFEEDERLNLDYIFYGRDECSVVEGDSITIYLSRKLSEKQISILKYRLSSFPAAYKEIYTKFMNEVRGLKSHELAFNLKIKSVKYWQEVRTKKPCAW